MGRRVWQRRELTACIVMLIACLRSCIYVFYVSPLEVQTFWHIVKFNWHCSAIRVTDTATERDREKLILNGIDMFGDYASTGNRSTYISYAGLAHGGMPAMPDKCARIHSLGTDHTVFGYTQSDRTLIEYIHIYLSPLNYKYFHFDKCAKHEHTI